MPRLGRGASCDPSPSTGAQTSPDAVRFACAGLSTLRPYRTRSAQLDGRGQGRGHALGRTARLWPRHAACRCHAGRPNMSSTNRPSAYGSRSGCASGLRKGDGLGSCSGSATTIPERRPPASLSGAASRALIARPGAGPRRRAPRRYGEVGATAGRHGTPRLPDRPLRGRESVPPDRTSR